MPSKRSFINSVSRDRVFFRYFPPLTLSPSPLLPSISCRNAQKPKFSVYFGMRNAKKCVKVYRPFPSPSSLPHTPSTPVWRALIVQLAFGGARLFNFYYTGAWALRLFDFDPLPVGLAKIRLYTCYKWPFSKACVFKSVTSVLFAKNRIIIRGFLKCYKW